MHLTPINVSTIVLLILMTLTVPVCLSQSPEDTRMRVAEAYEAVLDAYEAGGNVTGLVDRLNQALTLIAEAERKGDTGLIDRADDIVNSVLEEVPKVKEDGLKARNGMYILYGSVLTSIVVLAVLAYFYGPRVFWRIWLKLRAEYRVGVGPGGGSNSMILSGEVWAVVMAVVLVGSIFAATQVFMSGRVVEPFSELGVLGPGMKIGGYPKTLVAGESFRLYLYVGNHMGKPMYYVLFVKLGNSSTLVDPCPVEPFMRVDLIVMHGENRTIPLDLVLTEPGTNMRLIFEMWMYNSTVKTFTYHGRWCQLWVNVTAPPG